MDPVLMALLQSNEPLDDSQARHVRATLDATLVAVTDVEGEISKTFLSLVKLEQERCRRSQYVDTLKGTLSPIRRIPSEILVEIFLACRDNSLTASNYSIIDPREAPMLMGHVSSHWPPDSSQFRPILTRSGILPLHIQFEQWCGSPTATENLFDLRFQTHERLKSLCLCIRQTTTSSDSLSRIFSRPTPLPVLSSITLIVDGTFHATRVLALFHEMHQLRDVHLDTHPLPPHSLLSALPWAQFTRLELHSALELSDARDILAQCAMLQECGLDELINENGIEPLHHVHHLIHLQRFAISSNDVIAAEFLDVFSFPNLLCLNISAASLSPNVLVNLLARSKFSLEVLKLNVHGLKLIPLLQQLPSLRTLDLQHCADNALFKIFTCDPQEHVPAFALPQLTSLTITDHTSYLDGRIIADMVESVCSQAGGQNLAFPALATVELGLYGPSFNEDVEYRIAAASITGPIKDRSARY
ncbi:hypothetical protein FB451DRAFT_1519772, partial [Mycena latifolia]